MLLKKPTSSGNIIIMLSLCLEKTHLSTLSPPHSTEGKNGSRVTHVTATVGAPPDRQEDISYTDLRIIGSGSFGVVYQARLLETNDSVAIKKVLQDKRFKVRERERGEREVL